MADKKPEEITRNPKFGFLLYGNGYAAMVLESKPTVDQDNKDVIEFELSPTEELIKDYSLKIIPPRKDYVYKVQLPIEYVIQLNPSPHFTRWFYLKTYDGVITPAIKALFKDELLKEIVDLKEEIRRKEMEIDVSKEELELIKTNLPSYIKKNVFDIMDGAAPILSKFIPTKGTSTSSNG